MGCAANKRKIIHVVANMDLNKQIRTIRGGLEDEGFWDMTQGEHLAESDWNTRARYSTDGIRVGIHWEHVSELIMQLDVLYVIL